MKTLYLMSIALLSSSFSSPVVDLSQQPRALDEGIYQDIRLPHTIPLGGLGCGSVELGSDGWFQHLSINNNWIEDLPRPEGSFFAIWIRDGEHTASKVLRLSDADLPSVDHVRYQGVFPCSTLTFTDIDLPVDVFLDAWSPLVAWNLKDSSIPGAVFSLRCTNPAEHPIEVALAFSWENLLGLDTQQSDFSQQRIGNTQEIEGSRSVHGLVFRQLDKDEEEKLPGTYAIAVEEADEGSISYLPSWNVVSPDSFWDEFSDDGFLFDEDHPGPWPVGNEAISPAGAVAQRFTLPARSSRRVHFALAWHQPTLVQTEETERRPFYVEEFDDAWDTVKYLLDDREDLWGGTEKWRDALMRSSLPPWLRVRLLNDLCPFFSRTLLFEGRYAMIEDSRSGALQSNFNALLADAFLLGFFPELCESNLYVASTGQLPDGEIPSYTGTFPGILTDDTTGLAANQNPWGACGLILRLRLYDLLAGSDRLREELYPVAKNAALWLADRDQDRDGIPEGGNPRLDPGKTKNFSAVCSAWLAALHAVSDFASATNDLETLARYENLRARALENGVYELWNGRYLKAFFDPESPDDPASIMVSPDALVGEWYAATVGWEAIWPEAVIETTLQSLLRKRPFAAEAEVLDTGRLSTLASVAAQKGRAGDGFEIMSELHRHVTESGQAMAMPAQVGSVSGGVSNDIGGPVSWVFLNALTGASFNTKLERFTLSPRVPTESDRLEVPVFLPSFRGWLSYQAPSFESAHRITFRLNALREGRSLEIKQIATRVPPAFRDRNPVLFLEGSSGGGGVSRRSLGLLTLVLDDPLRLREGDDFTVVLGTEDTGRIDVNIKAHQVAARGPACKIDRLPDSPLAFTVMNRLQTPQMLNLRFTGLDGHSYRIAVDGREISPLETEGTRVTLPLPGGPFTTMQAAKAERTRRRLVRIVQLLTEYPAEQEALRKVWELQKTIERFFLADIGGRLATVDVYESDTDPPDREPAETLSEREAENLWEDLNEETEKFRSSIADAVSDPAVRARILGLAYPVDLMLHVEGDPSMEPEFDLTAVLSNPERLPLSGRFTLIVPEESWQATTLDSTELHSGPSPSERETRRFHVEMPSPLAVQRTEIIARFIGELDNRLFVLETIMPVGHGFLRDWMVLGPFPNEGDQQLTEVHYPEHAVDLDATYDGIGGSASWRAHYSGTGYIDFQSMFDVRGPALAFAHAFVYSPHDRPVVFHLGATQGVRIILNQQDVFTRNDHQPAQPSQYRIATRFRSGWNNLLVKVSRLYGDWGFYLEITDPAGRPIPELKVSLRR